VSVLVSVPSYPPIPTRDTDPEDSCQMTATLSAIIADGMNILKFIQLGVLLIGVAALYLYRRSGSQVRRRLPPGPKGLPIVGNIMDLAPTSRHEYLHWLKYKDLYGPIASITVLGQTIVIVHGRKEAYDILEKQSINTSSRPQTPFSNLCGFGRLLIFRNYDDVFRKQRKLVHQQLGTPATASQFNDIQALESHRLLLRILNSPENFPEHLKK
jgi:hypothetical protein